MEARSQGLLWGLPHEQRHRRTWTIFHFPLDTLTGSSPGSRQTGTQMGTHIGCQYCKLWFYPLNHNSSPFHATSLQLFAIINQLFCCEFFSLKMTYPPMYLLYHLPLLVSLKMHPIMNIHEFSYHLFNLLIASI